MRYDYAPAGMKTVTQTARCESDVPTACVPGYPKYSGAGFVKLNYGANGRLSSQEGRERASTETPTKSITTTYAQHGGPAQIIDGSSDITLSVGYYLDGTQRRVAESGVGAGGGGNVGNTNTYAYNGAGAVTVRTDRTGAAGVTGDETLTTSYRYNDAGLPAGMASQVLDPGSAGGVVTAYGWDQAGRLRSASTTTGSGLHRAEWSWHPNNALAGAKTTARISGADVVVGKYEYLYDKNRNVTKQIVTSDAGSGTGGYVNEYTYAPSEQLLSWDHQVTAGGGTAQETSYTWDKNSNRTSVTVDGVLASETSYNWDNSVAKVERPGKPDRVHAYNGFGLLTADGCNTYSYDAFDRVEKQVASGSTDCGSNGRTTTYDYDGLDRQRIVTVSSAAKPAANRATRSVFDGLSTSLVGQVGAVNGDNDGPSVLYQLDPGGAQTAYAQSGPGGASTGGSTAFLDTDGRGDVTAVTSFTTGSGAHALACAVRYDPFGTPVDAAPSGPSSHPDPASRGDGNGVCKTDSPAAEVTGNAVWYRGQVRDGSTGNYQLGTRTYDPGKAAFTTPDSYRVSSSATDLSVSVDPLTSNTYTYVNGNPINLIDPDGHKPICNGEECSFDVDAKGHFTNIKAASPAPWVPPEGYVADGAPLADFQNKKEFAGIIHAATAEGATPEEATRLAYERWFEAHLGGEGTVEGYEEVELAYCQVFGQHCKSDATLLDIGIQMARDTWNAITGCFGELELSSCGALAVDAALYAVPFGLGKIAQGAKIAGGLAKVERAANAGRTTARACSFAGATTVLMADGTQKPIEYIKVGDEVLATDPETGEQAAKKVEHVFVHDDDLTDLQLADGTVLTTTEDHPYWSVTDQRFERADELSQGERVLSADGRTVEVSGLRLASTRDGLAYNLSVEGIHTYHVGDAAILVHNSCFTSLDALNNPKLIEGLAPSQIDDLARNAGFEVRAGSASAKNPATRYYLPGTNGSQGFRVLPQGVPGQPGVKSGAYLKYFGGPLHGTRVPLGMP
ncbi:polymorphic toxin-type HINT domain-containing protein [Nocardioides sp. BYT-33-1]|uniref:polymorphic toxin-type HINT domain-containing protein n=1 Tax=Nocardioides sp. BYT-33-1 TaxID=3416952 RepID=UPI003F53126F